jgi:hypothetical protein
MTSTTNFAGLTGARIPARQGRLSNGQRGVGESLFAAVRSGHRAPPLHHPGSCVLTGSWANARSDRELEASPAGKFRAWNSKMWCSGAGRSGAIT